MSPSMRDRLMMSKFNLSKLLGTGDKDAEFSRKRGNQFDPERTPAS